MVHARFSAVPTRPIGNTTAVNMPAATVEAPRTQTAAPAEAAAAGPGAQLPPPSAATRRGDLATQGAHLQSRVNASCGFERLTMSPEQIRDNPGTARNNAGTLYTSSSMLEMGGRGPLSNDPEYRQAQQTLRQASGWSNGHIQRESGRIAHAMEVVSNAMCHPAPPRPVPSPFANVR